MFLLHYMYYNLENKLFSTVVALGIFAFFKLSEDIKSTNETRALQVLLTWLTEIYFQFLFCLILLPKLKQFC